jgi:sec-independent protein translocase protein TatA
MIGSGELMVILFLVLILFGGKKLPEFARSIGLGIREFKKACEGVEEDESQDKAVKKKQSEPISIEVEIDQDKH